MVLKTEIRGFRTGLAGGGSHWSGLGGWWWFGGGECDGEGSKVFGGWVWSEHCHSLFGIGWRERCYCRGMIGAGNKV